MKKTLILLAALIIATALVGAWTPWRMQHLIQIAIVLAIAGVGLAVFQLISRMILKRKGSETRSRTADTFSPSAEVWSAKPMILLLIMFLAEFCWVLAAAYLKSFVVAELGYYFLLLIFGYTLFRWGNSKQYVAVLAPIILLSLHATWDAISFLNNPSAQFRFGPEIVIFAASQMVGKLTMLPLDVVVTWGAWRLAESTRKSSNQALEATLDSAPQG